jgi:hypothetical protein
MNLLKEIFVYLQIKIEMNKMIRLLIENIKYLWANRKGNFDSMLPIIIFVIALLIVIGAVMLFMKKTGDAGDIVNNVGGTGFD